MGGILWEVSYSVRDKDLIMNRAVTSTTEIRQVSRDVNRLDSFCLEVANPRWWVRRKYTLEVLACFVPILPSSIAIVGCYVQCHNAGGAPNFLFLFLFVIFSFFLFLFREGGGGVGFWRSGVA